MEMNSVTGERPILVVAVADRAEGIPPALKATGKFDTELRLKLPDATDRVDLFRMFLNREHRFAGLRESL